MAEHGYQQYCGLARTLDVVGDRWTLLIVRELAPGPRRFTDLLGGLPGISRNLLTERLRALVRDGIVTTAQLPAPAARQVYELTSDGRDLAQAMVPLIAWGATRLGERKASEAFRPRWAALAMATFVDRDAAEGVDETYQYVVGDEAFHFIVRDGAIDLRDGHAEEPAATVTTDEGTWAQIASGEVSASSAVATGALTLTGDPRAVERLAKLFSRRRVLAGVDTSIKRTARQEPINSRPQ